MKSDFASEKYPRTSHFPFSPGATNDDRVAGNWEDLLHHKLTITEKLDGENTCIKANGIYARSHGAVNRNPWAKPIWEIWERIGNSLDDLHLFGENLYAIHSIEYEQLTHYFYLFAIRDGDTWLSWDTVCEYAQILDLPTVPQIACGHFEVDTLKQLIYKHQSSGSLLGGASEGVVCRRSDAFVVDVFDESVLKYVRKNHVQTNEHWTKNWKKASLKAFYHPSGYQLP